jgi:hypothetical protein
MKGAFVVVYNMPEKDLRDGSKVSLIEKDIKFVINFCTKSEVRKSDIIFSFSCDPSIATNRIPLTCKITLLGTVHESLRKQIAAQVATGLWSKIKKQKGKTLAIVGDETGKMSSSLLNPKKAK